MSPSLEILRTLWNRQPVVADTDLKMTLILVQPAAQQSQEVPSNFNYSVSYLTFYDAVSDCTSIFKCSLILLCTLLGF